MLRPGGFFYALTPAYPSVEAFCDPTHVNIITNSTHRYFTGESPLARMYGFQGHFMAKRAEFAVYRDSLDPLQPPNLRQRWRHLEHRIKGKLSYMVWEFVCSKP